MTNAFRNEYYQGLYLKRPDEAAPAALTVLHEAPEHDLTQEKKQEVYEFEHQLFNRVLENGITIGEVFRERLEDEAIVPKFYLDYFTEDPDGMAFVNKAFGVEVPQELTADQFRSLVLNRIHSVQKTEANGVGTEEDATDIDWPDISAKSFAYYKAKQATKIVYADKFGELDNLELELDFIPVCVKPEHVIRQILNLKQAKKAIKWENRLLKDEEDSSPKQAILEIYLGKINSQLSEYLSRLDQIKAQAEVTGDEALAKSIESLPNVRYEALLGDELKRRTFYRRLDLLRNGAGQVDGQIKPYSGTMAELLTVTNSREVENSPSYFTPEQFEKLKKMKLTPEEIVAVVSKILDRLGLLTEDKTVSHEAPPSDGKFRVVLNPNKNSYQIDSKSMSYRVGHSPQPLDRVMAVVDLHEFKHILDSLADAAIARHLYIAQAAIHGKRTGYLLEMGANTAQRSGENYLFGKSSEADPVPTYLAALVQLDEGGSYEDAVKAFYKVKKQRFPKGSSISQAKEAIDRVARLLRFGQNSAPLSYAEEGIIEGVVRNMAFGEDPLKGIATCLDLVDQVRLHKQGLMPKAEVSVSQSEMMEIMLDVLEPYIIQALSSPDPIEEN